MAVRRANERAADDAWTHSPELVERHRRAREQRAYVLGPEDLEKIARDAEDAHASGRDYHASESELQEMEAKHLAPLIGRSGSAHLSDG